MIAFKSLLIYYVKKDGLTVIFGDINAKEINGSGNMKCKPIEFKNVSFVEGLQNNLILINHVCINCYKAFLNKEKGHVVDSGNSIVFDAIRKNNAYIFY